MSAPHPPACKRNPTQALRPPWSCCAGWDVHCAFPSSLLFLSLLSDVRPFIQPTHPSQGSIAIDEAKSPPFILPNPAPAQRLAVSVEGACECYSPAVPGLWIRRRWSQDETRPDTRNDLGGLSKLGLSRADHLVASPSPFISCPPTVARFHLFP